MIAYCYKHQYTKDCYEQMSDIFECSCSTNCCHKEPNVFAVLHCDWDYSLLLNLVTAILFTIPLQDALNLYPSLRKLVTVCLTDVDLAWELGIIIVSPIGNSFNTQESGFVFLNSFITFEYFYISVIYFAYISLFDDTKLGRYS